MAQALSNRDAYVDTGVGSPVLRAETPAGGHAPPAGDRNHAGEGVGAESPAPLNPHVTPDRGLGLHPFVPAGLDVFPEERRAGCVDA
jgi:hypothetical protein